MSDDRPDDDGGMFFVGMRFQPDASLKQSALNTITVELLRRLFTTADGSPLLAKHEDAPMLSLVQLLVDLDMRIDDKTFADFPESIKRHFMVQHRDGLVYRYGSQPRRF